MACCSARSWSWRFEIAFRQISHSRQTTPGFSAKTAVSWCAFARVFRNEEPEIRARLQWVTCSKPEATRTNLPIDQSSLRAFPFHKRPVKKHGPTSTDPPHLLCMPCHHVPWQHLSAHRGPSPFIAATEVLYIPGARRNAACKHQEVVLLPLRRHRLES